MRKIETKCYMQTAWISGECYHVVEIFADDIKVDEKHIHCADDDCDASCYAVEISKALTQEEKESYEF